MFLFVVHSLDLNHSRPSAINEHTNISINKNKFHSLHMHFGASKLPSPPHHHKWVEKHCKESFQWYCSQFLIISKELLGIWKKCPWPLWNSLTCLEFTLRTRYQVNFLTLPFEPGRIVPLKSCGHKMTTKRSTERSSLSCMCAVSLLQQGQI